MPVKFDRPDSIPVLIPAYNEEQVIRQTLSTLPKKHIEPIVIVNGSNDATAATARAHGVKVIVIEQAGKLPAIQIGLRNIGAKALMPLCVLDADTRPVFPNAWIKGMTSHVSAYPEHTPEVVGGPVWFTGSSYVSTTIRSLRRIELALRSRIGNDIFSQCGPNMAMNLKNETALDAILNLPNYWPYEDVAICHTVQKHGGIYTQPVSPQLLTLTPESVSFTSLSERLKLGQEHARQNILQSYIVRGPADAIPYIRNDAHI